MKREKRRSIASWLWGKGNVYLPSFSVLQSLAIFYGRVHKYVSSKAAVTTPHMLDYYASLVRDLDELLAVYCEAQKLDTSERDKVSRQVELVAPKLRAKFLQFQDELVEELGRAEASSAYRDAMARLRAMEDQQAVEAKTYGELTSTYRAFMDSTVPELPQ